MTRFINLFLFHSVFTIIGSTASRITDAAYNLDDDTNVQTKRKLRFGAQGQGQGQHQGGRGQGWQGGGQGGHGQGNGYGHMETIQKLFDHRDEISRNSVEETKLEDDSKVAMAYTTSGNSDVARWIKLHVKQMVELTDSGMMLRHWDDLFEEMFDHRNEMTLDWEEVDGGVRAVMSANNPDSPCPKALADAHTKLITAFIENGRAEAQKNHPAPNECT